MVGLDIDWDLYIDQVIERYFTDHVIFGWFMTYDVFFNEERNIVFALKWSRSKNKMDKWWPLRDMGKQHPQWYKTLFRKLGYKGEVWVTRENME